MIGIERGNVPADTTTTYVTVQPGQTLWGIISAHDTRDNMNSAIEWTENLNHINGDLHPGQVIEVPVGR